MLLPHDGSLICARPCGVACGGVQTISVSEGIAEVDSSQRGVSRSHHVHHSSWCSTTGHVSGEGTCWGQETTHGQELHRSQGRGHVGS